MYIFRGFLGIESTNRILSGTIWTVLDNTFLRHVFSAVGFAAIAWHVTVTAIGA